MAAAAICQQYLTAYGPFVEYLAEGEGTRQWQTAGGTLVEQPVAVGDAVFCPPDVMEHRILNTGRGSRAVLYGGTPSGTIARSTARL